MAEIRAEPVHERCDERSDFPADEGSRDSDLRILALEQLAQATNYVEPITSPPAELATF
jgi:hypothetical protein